MQNEIKIKQTHLERSLTRKFQHSNQNNQNNSDNLKQNPTLSILIDTIQFTIKKKTKNKSVIGSQTHSFDSSSMKQRSKDKSKVWKDEQIQLFQILLQKYGTYFHILSKFFPNKTQSQLKNKYKMMENLSKKIKKQKKSDIFEHSNSQL